MRFLPTDLPGVLIVEPDVFRDARGFFIESYQFEKFRPGGIGQVFVQDNHSFSKRGVLRGLHMQYRRPQAKLVRVVSGEIYDVAVDVRRGSPSFGEFAAANLSGENFRQMFIPAGYAHGFVVLSDEAHVLYKADAYYDAHGELTVRWDDPELAIPWPTNTPIVSDKDRAGLSVAEAQRFLTNP